MSPSVPNLEDVRREGVSHGSPQALCRLFNVRAVAVRVKHWW